MNVDAGQSGVDVRNRVTRSVPIVGAMLAGLLALLSWAFASPVASAPDDDLHIANIYCVSDSSTCRSQDWDWPFPQPWWADDPADRTGPEYEGAQEAYPDLWPNPRPREYPCYISNGTGTYSPNAAIAPTCLGLEDPADNQPGTVDILTYYPQHYYRAMAVFTQDTIRKSVATWRVVNVLLAVVMFTIALRLTAPSHRRAVAVSAVIASIPLGMFLIASDHPASWMLIGTAAFLGPAITLLRSPPAVRPVIARVAFLILCLVMLVAGRSEGVLHAGALIVVALLLGLKGSRVVYWSVGAVAVVLAILALVVTQASDATKAQLNLVWLTDGVGDGRLWDSLMSTPQYFFGTIPTAVGWLDIVPGPITAIASNAAFWGAILLGLAVMFWRKAFAVGFVLVGLLVVPAVLVAGGAQPYLLRYFLPLMYALAFAALVPRWGGWLPAWSRAQWLALWAAVSVANSVALLYVNARFVSGISEGTTNPRNLAATPTPDWWWDLWFGPFANWLVGSVAFAVAVGLLWSRSSATRAVVVD